MKNRILWIFEDQNPTPESVAASLSTRETDADKNTEAGASFDSIPWVLFGALGRAERERVEHAYEVALEKSLGQRGES